MSAKKTNNKSDIKFSYQLSAVGLAKLYLKIAEQEIATDVTNLEDPLSKFLLALVRINPLYAGTIVNRNAYKEAKVTSDVFTCWSGRVPYTWELNFHSKNKLHILIRKFDPRDEVPKKITVFEAVCYYNDFVKAVIDSLTALLHRFSFVGYYQTWGGFCEFPITHYIKLKHYLISNNAYAPSFDNSKSVSVDSGLVCGYDIEYELANFLK